MLHLIELVLHRCERILHRLERVLVAQLIGTVRAPMDTISSLAAWEWADLGIQRTAEYFS